MSQYLILLALVPLSCFELFRQIRSTYKNTLYGLSIGLVIAPVGFSFLRFTGVPVIGKFLGLLGLAIHLTHGWPGYVCLLSTGLIEPGVLLTAAQLTVIQLFNGLLWASVYGLIGYAMDVRRRHAVFNREIFSPLTY